MDRHPCRSGEEGAQGYGSEVLRKVPVGQDRTSHQTVQREVDN